MGEDAKPGPTFNGGNYTSAGGGPPPPCRRRRTSCCGPCCIVKHVLGLLITLILLVGIAALVIWLVLRPTKPNFYVDSVKFSNISNSSSSNMMVGMSVRNENKRMDIYYDTLRASAYYSYISGGGSAIGAKAVEPFYQGHKNTTTLPTLVIYLPSTSTDVELKLRSRVRFRVGEVKSNRFKLKVKCHIVFVLLNETSAAAFTRKKCKVELDH